MGPQLYRCGNLEIIETSKSLDVVLQWGRNFIVAETSTPGTRHVNKG